MPLYGITAGTEDKPKWLSTAEKELTYATRSGWVYNNPATGTQEVIAACPNLILTLGVPTIDRIEIDTAAVTPGSGKTVRTNIYYNEAVTVTPGATHVLKSSRGAIATLGSITAGSGYTPGTYNATALTGGNGASATANIVVGGGGTVTSVTIAAAGTFYKVGDALSASGATLTLQGQIATLGAITAGSGYTNGTYNATALTGGTGTGATADIVVGSGGVTTVTIVNKGSGYTVSDVLSASGVTLTTQGQINTLGSITAGSGYTDGTYNATALTGGDGTGATADITVSGGEVTVVTIVNKGSGYAVANNLSASGATLTAQGQIATLGSITGGSNYSDGTYNGVALTGGTGTGATADITVASGAVTVVTIVNKGTGYTVSDALSAADASLGGGGGSGFSVPVATLVADGSGFSVPVATLVADGSGFSVPVATLVADGSGFSVPVATVTAGSYTLTYDAALSTPSKGILAFKNTSLSLIDTEVLTLGGASGGSISGTITDTYDVTNTTGVAATLNTLVGGTGYAVASGVRTSGGSGAGLKVDISTVEDGQVASIEDLVGGTDYEDDEDVTTTSDGDGTDLTVDIVTVDGVVTEVTIVDPGSGYIVGEEVTIDGGNDDATFVVASVNDGVITAVAISAAGDGYAAGDTVQIAGGLNNATVNVATVTAAPAGLVLSTFTAVTLTVAP